MRTMKDMHKEIRGKALTDGGWPQSVAIGPGIIALARNQAHKDELLRSTRRAHIFGFVTAATCAIIGLASIVFGT